MGKLGKIIKAGMVMGVVGILLAASAPLIAGMLGEGILGAAGMAAAAHSFGTMAWTGAFFGTFGALHAAITPVFDAIDGTAGKADAAQARINAHLDAPCCAQGIAHEQEVVSHHFRQQEDQRRGAVVATQIS